jgi:predicted secreted protein
MTQGKAGYGVTLTYSGNAIAQILDITPPNPKANVIDVTTHDSTSGYKEKILGLIDGGQVKIKGNFYPGDTNGQIVLSNARANRTLLSSMILAFPSTIGCSWTFNAYVTEFQIISPIDKQVTFEAQLEITGVPTLGVTASSNLTGLTISVGTLVQAFSASVYNYIDSLTNGTASVTVTPTNAAAASITVNGVVVSSGAASGAITTAVGNTLITIVTQDTGKAPVVYVINCGRAS